jgi:hypothetical protein
MKKIFTLFTVLLFAVAASQAQTGSVKPIVSPNPAHDYIKVNWQQAQSSNVTIAMYNFNGTLAKTLTNRMYGEGTYSEMFKIGLPRGAYFVKVTIGNQMWSYKMLVQ